MTVPCTGQVQFHYTNQSILTQISVEQILSIVPPVWAYVAVDSVLPSCYDCSCLHISLSCEATFISV